MKTNRLSLIAMILAFLLLSTLGFSQEPMKFRNIPLRGTLTEFANQLVKLGYTIEDKTEKDVIIMSGQFANNKCEIILLGTLTSNIIWKVGVYFPKNTSWSSIKREYQDLKEQFTAKYGIGESFAYFKNPYVEGDGFEMTALKLGKCSYATFWESESGIIKLSISKVEQVSVSYEDSVNVKIKDKEANEKIMNDI